MKGFSITNRLARLSDENQIGRGIRLYHGFIALELASKIEQAVREALEAARQSLGAELEFDIFLVLDGREVRFVMEPV